MVVWDDFGAGEGSLIAVSEGAEAAQPFRPELKADRCVCAAILDQLIFKDSYRETLESQRV